MKLIINITEDDYKWIKEHDKDTFLYSITESLYDNVRKGTILKTNKFVSIDDIVKRYMFHAEEKAEKEISQILYEVKKYSEDEI